jgi:hypothetical protein
MKARRIVLLVVAGLLSASALLAIGILLVGRFGDTEGRILGTTALLAGYGLLSLPGVVLLGQGRLRILATGQTALVAVSAALALAAIWGFSDSAMLGKSLGTATLAAVASGQAAFLAGRRQDRDPASVRRLFAASCGTAAIAVAAGTALLWAQPHAAVYPRLFGALVVLDLLLAALQPVLARARPAGPVHRLGVVLDTGETVAITIEGTDLATAAARAIRKVERDGHRVARLEVGADDDEVDYRIARG